MKIAIQNDLKQSNAIAKLQEDCDSKSTKLDQALTQLASDKDAMKPMKIRKRRSLKMGDQVG